MWISRRIAKIKQKIIQVLKIEKNVIQEIWLLLVKQKYPFLTDSKHLKGVIVLFYSDNISLCPQFYQPLSRTRYLRTLASKIITPMSLTLILEQSQECSDLIQNLPSSMYKYMLCPLMCIHLGGIPTYGSLPPEKIHRVSLIISTALT